MSTSLEIFDQKRHRILVILAGGASTRMLQDKALLPIGKSTLLEYVLGKLSANFSQSYISSSTTYLKNQPHISDLWASKLGPVSAIVSSILHLQANLNYTLTFVPVDMPALTPALLEKLVRSTKHISCFAGSPLPVTMCLSAELIAYSKSVAGQLNRGESISVNRFISEAPFPTNLIQLDKHIRLKNINYPKEWKEFCDENSM